jgi:hypothetical protein
MRLCGFLFSLGLLLGLPLDLLAQYRWVKLDSTPDQEALYWQQTQVGTWSHSVGKYYPFDGQRWGQPCEPPIAAPIENFGVRRGQLAGKERVSINGKEVTAEQARRKLLETPIDDKSLPDDKGKPFWVVVGSAQDSARARALLESAPFSGVGRVQYYRPDDAMIKDRDGKLMYREGITLVEASGAVIGHTDRYDSAEDLAEGLRRLQPNFDPANVSSLKERALSNAILSAAPAVLAAAGAVLFFLLALVHLLRNKK